MARRAAVTLTVALLADAVVGDLYLHVSSPSRPRARPRRGPSRSGWLSPPEHMRVV